MEQEDLLAMQMADAKFHNAEQAKQKRKRDALLDVTKDNIEMVYIAFFQFNSEWTFSWILLLEKRERTVMYKISST